MYCTMCGQDHQGASGCPITTAVPAPTTYVVYERTIQTTEQMTTCPVCHGNSMIPQSLMSRLEKVLDSIQSLFRP